MFFGEAVVVHDIPDPLRVSVSRQLEEVHAGPPGIADLAAHPVVGFVLRVEIGHSKTQHKVSTMLTFFKVMSEVILHENKEKGETVRSESKNPNRAVLLLLLLQ